MVVVKKYLGTQIDNLPDVTGRVLYDSTLNALRFHNASNFGSIIAHKDASNNMSGINNFRTTGNVGINTTIADKQVEINSSTGDCLRLTYNDNNGSASNYSDLLVSSSGDLTLTASGGNVNISSHNGSTAGLQLNGTLVTSTAAQLNYNNVTPGTVSTTKAMIVDSSRNIGNLNNLRTTGNVGINTSIPDKQVEINSSTGDCLRLTYNDSDGSAANYTDLLITSSGDLNITPSGGDLNLTTHNGSSTGLKLNGTLVTATATELNYNSGSTPGNALPNKTMVFDSNKNLIGVNYLEVENIVALKTGPADNAIDYPISLITLPVNEAAIGLGTGIEFNSVNDSDAIYNAGYINYISSVITDGSESGFFNFKLANGGIIDSICTISNNGVVSATSYVETSDFRSKENIQETISVDSLAKILQVKVKTYNYKKDLDKKSHIGVIAQEIKNIVPESVVISKTDDFDDFHQVSYTSLIPHLINCIKVLHEELEELKSKI